MMTCKVPRALLLPAMMMAVCFAPHAGAQQLRQVFQPGEAYQQPGVSDMLKETATAVNRQRSELFAKKDAAGIASLYTADATYIELLPRLQMMSGRPQIAQHFRELFAAHGTQLESAVTSAQMIDANTQLVGGDYFIVAGGKKIAGHFVQILRRDAGGWKIASHVFARPEPITVGEEEQYRG